MFEMDASAKLSIFSIQNRKLAIKVQTKLSANSGDISHSSEELVQPLTVPSRGQQRRPGRAEVARQSPQHVVRVQRTDYAATERLDRVTVCHESATHGNFMSRAIGMPSCYLASLHVFAQPTIWQKKLC